jgi:hypothetical protein
MKNIKVNNNEYYDGDKIRELHPIYFSNARNVRETVKKKNISSDNYIFAIYDLTTNTWKKTNGANKKLDKILFKIEWAKNTIPELADKKDVKHDIEEAPPIINLKEEEIMKDTDGNSLDIEIRGERTVDKSYFKVKDVMKGFEMKHLEKNIVDERSCYSINKDYIFFNCVNILFSGKKSKKKTVKKEMFLTYYGLLRVLFASHSEKARKFAKWASEILFTHQFGTLEQKDKLVAKVKGVSYETIQELFSINARTMPCIYLTCLNRVKELRDIMNIDDKYDDDDFVYKFGLTKDFEQRKNGHKSEYKELGNLIDMKLVCFSFIDPLYISDAEAELKNILSDNKIEYKKHDELVVLPRNIFKFVKESYEKLAMKYSGHTESFLFEKSKFESQLKDLENKLENEKMRHELKEQDLNNKLKEQDLNNKIREMELTKNNEILKLENNYLQKINNKQITKKK